MNDSIKAGSSAVSSARLTSGAKVKEAPQKQEQREPAKAVDSVISEVGKARESVEQISHAATARIEVVKENQSASRTKVSDVEEAARLAKDLKLNIRQNHDNAQQAHSINTSKAKDLLK